MKHISGCILALFLLLQLHNDTSAQAPVTVRSHDHVDMTWFGPYDRWAEFPANGETFRKIILHYTMGCATGGCSPWDYTTKIELLHRTGELDSTLQQQASFTVNNAVTDTFRFNMDTTYTTFYNSTTMGTDSSANAVSMIILFGNPLSPAQPTDTIYGWEAGYRNYQYDASGNVTDSLQVTADSTWIVSYTSYYNVTEVIETYELARVITPYGGNLPSGYSFTQDFDVTDFEQLLRDSVEIRAFYSGWSSGFSATLDFEFFPGTPPRNVVKIENIYRGDFGYSTSSGFESSYLYPKNFFIAPGSATARVRMTTTGHGFDNNQVAAEFLPMTYTLKVDGQQTHSQLNWRDDCGENPIYPDYETSTAYVHTWLYDRANWCPGLKAHTHLHEITPYITANDSVNLNVDFQNFSWSGNQAPSYTIDCQLVQYGAPNFANDVELARIIAPSDEDEFARLNPICTAPRVLVRNYGSAALTGFDIDYHIDGGPTETFHWTGNLAFMDTVSVILPISNISTFWTTSTGQRIFYAAVKNPNGVADQYSDNNSLSASYDDVPTFPGQFIVNFKTNATGSESAYRITDAGGTVVAQRNGMSNSTVYSDTLSLTEGCYVFEVTDAGEDGLYFYYNSSGTGFCRLKNVGGSIFRTYKPNFGTAYREHFKVGYLFGNEEESSVTDISIYPNPSQGSFTVDLAGFSGDVQMEVYNLVGERVQTVKQQVSGNLLVNMDLSSVPSGIYIVRIAGNGNSYSRRVVIAR